MLEGVEAEAEVALRVPAHILAQVQERVVEAVEVVWRRSQPVQGGMQQGAVEEAQLVPPTHPVLALVLAQQGVWEEAVHHQMTVR